MRAVLALGLSACIDEGLDLRPGVPTQPDPTPEGPSVVDVDAGFGNTCVVRSDGEVLCWGAAWSDYYRTGTPKKVEGIEGATRVRVNRYLGCALVGGPVRCFTFAADHAEETPQPVPGLADDIVDLSLGDLADVCFLHVTGRVSCWFHTFADQAEHLFDIAGAEDVVELSRGGFCGIRSDRSLACWSRVGDTIQPVVTFDVPPIRAMAGRGGFSRYEALAEDGSIWAFNQGPGGVFTAPAPIAAIPGATEIANHQAQSCVRTDGGEVYCYEPDASAEAPVPVAPRRMEVSGVSAFGVGIDHTCVTNSSSVFCWGSNETGNLGLGFKGEKELAEARAVVRGAGLVASGDRSTCATAELGISCWGANESGQLGTGDRIDRMTPVDGPRLTDVVDLAAGSDSFCALHRSGIVSCWGNNEAGQLGVSDAAWRGTAEQVSGVDGAIALSMGGRRACVVRQDRTLWCWGTDASGIGAASGIEHVDVGAEILGVSVGRSHTCAWGIGSAWCWGENSEGQLGVFRSSDQPVHVPDVGRIQRMSTAGARTCFGNREGVTACFGSVYGQRTVIEVSNVREIHVRPRDLCLRTDRGLECGSEEEPSIVSVVPASSGVIDASFGTDHYCVRDEAGTVSCAGSGRSGALGDGDGYRESPSLVVF